MPHTKGKGWKVARKPGKHRAIGFSVSCMTSEDLFHNVSSFAERRIDLSDKFVSLPIGHFSLKEAGSMMRNEWDRKVNL